MQKSRCKCRYTDADVDVNAIYETDYNDVDADLDAGVKMCADVNADVLMSMSM